MTTVGELFHSLDRDEVIATIDRLYPKSPVDYPSYQSAWQVIRRKEAASRTRMVCELYAAPSDEDPAKTYIGVHGRDLIDGVAYAIEFVQWAEWLAMEVRILPECGEISPVEPLAHIFWEMTWVGYDESEIADQKQEIMDLADEANEMLDSETPTRS